MAGSEDATSTNEEDTPAELTKPVELERVGSAAEGLFEMLGRWFDSGAVLTADISSIHTDAVAAELRDPQMVARFTMRRLQALYLIALPGTRTTTDVVVMQIDSILRALLETPSRHLRRASEDVDWDHEWAVLDAGMLLASECPEQEAQLFQAHIDTLVSAREAVLRDSGRRICIFH